MDAWSADQLKKMQAGGNGKLNDFFKQYGVDKYVDIRDKYNSRVAEVRLQWSGIGWAARRRLQRWPWAGLGWVNSRRGAAACSSAAAQCRWQLGGSIWLLGEQSGMTAAHPALVHCNLGAHMPDSMHPTCTFPTCRSIARRLRQRWRGGPSPRRRRRRCRLPAPAAPVTTASPAPAAAPCLQPACAAAPRAMTAGAIGATAAAAEPAAVAAPATAAVPTAASAAIASTRVHSTCSQHRARMSSSPPRCRWEGLWALGGVG